MAQPNWQPIGPYRGMVSDALWHPDLIAALVEVSARLGTDAAILLQGGRHQTFRLSLPCGGDTREVVVKRFGRQSGLKDCWDRAMGTKGARTYATTSFLVRHGIGTTRPVAILERWAGHRLVESLFVSDYLHDAISFKDRLLHLFDGGGDAADVLATIQSVAAGIRRLHDAGCLHNDLGNQNILLCGDASRPTDEWRVAFLDLDRARCGVALSLWGRARDLSRVTLPSQLLHYFFEAYWQGPAPRQFMLLEALNRLGFAWHTFTRLLRHPLREIGYRKRRGTPDAPQHAVYPRCRDRWIWDARNRRPLPVTTPFERWLHAPPLLPVCRLAINLAAAGRVARQQRAIRRALPLPPVAFNLRVLAEVDGLTDTVLQKSVHLRELGIDHVFLRLYHHEAAAQRQVRLAAAQAWIDAGYRLSVGLVQSRVAVHRPADWIVFCGDVLGQLAPQLEWAEVGYAIDDSLWGVWGLDEYRRLLAEIGGLAQHYPDVKLVGPSVSLFTSNALLPAFHQLPASMAWQAASLRLEAADANRSDAALLKRLIGARAQVKSAAGRCVDTNLILTGFTETAPSMRQLATALRSGMVHACVLQLAARRCPT